MRWGERALQARRMPFRLPPRTGHRLGCPSRDRVGLPPHRKPTIIGHSRREPPFPFNSLYPPAPRCGAAWKRPGNRATPTRCPASPTFPYVDLGAGRRPAGGYL